MRLRPLDLAILILAIFVLGIVSLSVYGVRGGRLSVVISGNGQEWVYPLNEDRRVEVPGPLGTTVVEVQQGGARIVSSPCPNQTCVAAGSIERAGQWLACLPNQVFVRIEGGGDDEGLDAAAY